MAINGNRITYRWTEGDTIGRVLRRTAQRYWNDDKIAIRQKKFGIWNEYTWKQHYKDWKRDRDTKNAGNQGGDVHVLLLSVDKPTLWARKVAISGSLGAPVKRMLWNWGDGAISATQKFPGIHEYAKPGWYNIVLKVFFKDGYTESRNFKVQIR